MNIIYSNSIFRRQRLALLRENFFSVLKLKDAPEEPQHKTTNILNTVEYSEEFKESNRLTKSNLIESIHNKH